MTKSKLFWKIGRTSFKFGIALWLLSTVFFLIAYGWHTEPANEIEARCDGVSWFLIVMGFLFKLFAVDEIISLFITADVIRVKYKTKDE